MDRPAGPLLLSVRGATPRGTAYRVQPWSGDKAPRTLVEGLRASHKHLSIHELLEVFAALLNPELEGTRKGKPVFEVGSALGMEIIY